MKHQWVAYVIVALLSIGAGVAIAGLPDNQPVDPTIIPPTTTERPTPTLATTTVPVASTAPPATASPETTEAVTATTSSTTTVVPATTAPPPTDEVVPARGELDVAVANGANIEGLATATADDLVAIGYTDVAALDGTLIADFTVVYFAPGFESSAIRLAEDLGANPDLRAPLSDAPPVDGLSDVQLLVYLGIDRPAP